ncbi:MAG: nucleoside permease [Planctomycetaceae bacterium]|nr:nucleoside permease [Planctomycetaceae bacterium]
MGIETSTYIALSVVMFLEFAVWGAWSPVLAARLLGPLKMTGKQTGWIYATLPVACIISPLVAGWLADQYVDMKWILIVAHLVGAVLLFVAAKQSRFAPLLVVMFLYSLCYAATMPLVNAALFRETSDGAVTAKVFLWAPVAWALVGWSLTGWRMTRKTQGDGSDCLYFAAALSILMALGCCLLEAKPLPATGKIPVLEALGMLGQTNFLVFVLISLVVAGLMQFYFLGSAQFMQDMGISSRIVPAAMALAQIAQAAATWFLLTKLTEEAGFKWTLAIGACCWFLLYVIYIVGRPQALIILAQPLHGFAYVFFIIAGQMCANNYATPEIVGSMQALIFAATSGVGLFLGTQFAGIIMDKYSVDGKFQWRKVWIVPCVIALVGALVLANVFQDPAAEQKKAAPDANAPVSARDA